MALAADSIGAMLVGAAATGALYTALALAYARRARLIDEPGQRRSHATATPRGGGVGILLAMLAMIPFLPDALGDFRAFALGLTLVAGVGWIDDHRSLSARLRLVVHVLAAAMFVATLPRDGDATARAWLIGAVQVFLLVGAINFWNFMDGINGLIATQSIAVSAIVALLLGAAGAPGWALLAIVVAGACLGFLPFNFPRAKIFLGDVGSGGLGFACGALLLQAQALGAIDALGALVAMSVIGIDATLTLLSRIVRGRRWYDPHREHLYQWLVRRGRSHAVVTSLYLLWNLIVVLPVLVLMRQHPAWSPALGVGALAAGTLMWFAGKRALARRPA